MSIPRAKLNPHDKKAASPAHRKRKARYPHVPQKKWRGSRGNQSSEARSKGDGGRPQKGKLHEPGDPTQNPISSDRPLAYELKRKNWSCGIPQEGKQKA